MSKKYFDLYKLWNTYSMFSQYFPLKRKIRKASSRIKENKTELFFQFEFSEWLKLLLHVFCFVNAIFNYLKIDTNKNVVLSITQKTQYKFTYLFNKYLLNPCYVSSIVESNENKVIDKNKAQRSWCSHCLVRR